MRFLRIHLLAIFWLYFTSSSIIAFNSEQTVYLHPLSPRETDPENVRVKRQAYQIYVGNDASITVDKNGSPDSGVWGPWNIDKPCSRTCGGGVQTEKRTCNGECTGPSIRYVSCNIEDCIQSQADFRAEQCAAHNDEALDNTYYKWVPYPGKNKCELACKPENKSFYYKWADKVIDGTRCDDLLADSVCVDGVCLPLGCDDKLGSSAKNDKCGICNGNGTSCKTVEGFFDERNLSPGYHDIIILPVGATSIKIKEIRPTSNSLAIKNSSGHFYLNGNYQIQVLEKDSVVAGGSIFKYEKPKGEKGQTEGLSANGPLNEELTVALLYQTGGSKSSAIKYEFSIPLEEQEYIYKTGKWSECSVTCGKGVKTRTPFCIKAANEQRVDDSVCDENNATKPELEKSCETTDCEAEWFIGKWEQCSQTCGHNGWQYRVVYCHKVFADGRRITVSDGNCSAVERPQVKQTCNRFSCPDWHNGPWSACSEKCGDAKQYRSVTCRSEKLGEEGKMLPADACNTTVELVTERSCNLGPCEGLNFHTTEWNLCERCNDTEETRNVTCRDNSARLYPLEKCLNKTLNKIPIDTRPCATQAPCIYEWHTSQWSKCSTECGHGHKNRNVNCAINELGKITIVDSSLCTSEKPINKEECVNEEKCTGTYFSGPWSNCSEKCNGGTQTRIVVCLNYDKKPVPEWCDESDKPAEEQECNVEPCPNCKDSEFGCCPDNTTFANGEWLDGCSNCTISKFGCCDDNVTEATGPNGKGCDGILSLDEEGSGEGATTTEPTECEVTNEKTGEKTNVPCSSTTDSVVALLEGDVDNSTLTGNATTKHCSKTEFGCCPDWYTPAEGKDNAGCPTFVLGACNETQHGCCTDNVTLARGPNFEGCGDPNCAASLFGCCKDRKTIAFGSHYAGCERSSFPCELSTFGCCPDGETAALDKNLTGCGATCLLTKFGCCPDGVTRSKGFNNEGCGCEFAQFGCCPDGKSTAKGAGYYGCPETCAQSQYGCCPDGKTAARGQNKEGCPCQYTRWGCCEDGETTALGPRNDGCDDCRYAKFGCCPDGISKASGPENAGCPSTTPAPYIVGGTVAPEKIIACNLPQDQGQVCHPGYKLVWFYDISEGRCSQFWYGGCGGNANNFATKEQCEQICVEPPQTGRCYLPKVDGPQRCQDLTARYWYDYVTKQCAAFWWRGCLGNSNNFASWEQCQHFCSGVEDRSFEISSPRNQEQRVPEQRVPEQRIPEQRVPEQRLPEQRLPEYPQPQPQQVTYPQIVTPATRVDSRYNPSVVSIEAVKAETPSTSQRPKTLPTWKPHIENQKEQSQQIVEPDKTAEQLREEIEQQQKLRAQQLAERVAIEAAREQALREEQLQENQSQRAQQIAERERAAIAHQQALREREKMLREQAEQTLREKSMREPEPKDQKTTTTTTIATTLAAPPSKDYYCRLTQNSGTCQSYQDQYYFDYYSGKCLKFIYTGCGGNLNRFATEEECKKRCGHLKPLAGPVSIPSSSRGFVKKISKDKNRSSKSQEICNLKLDVGRCEGHFDSYYYNFVNGECEQFQYSGCGGNANRFHTKEQCNNMCLRGPGVPSGGVRTGLSSFATQHSGISDKKHPAPPGQEVSASSSVCDAQKDTGSCSRFVTKWYYNKADGTCNRFHYGGCEGNGNRFETEQECKNTCGDHIDTCFLPKVVGPCAGKNERYFFDQSTKQCTKFEYSGCLGNNNNFRSVEDCEDRCRQTNL